MEAPLCPKCNLIDDVIVIIYGQPTSVMIEKAEEGKIALGGSVKSEDSPDWECKKCGVTYKIS